MLKFKLIVFWTSLYWWLYIPSYKVCFLKWRVRTSLLQKKLLSTTEQQLHIAAGKACRGRGTGGPHEAFPHVWISNFT